MAHKSKIIYYARKLGVYIIMLAMLVLAVFQTPRIDSFIVGAALAFIGLALRVWACGHLYKNEKLACTGPYSHLKHPLYLGTFFIVFGLVAPMLFHAEITAGNFYSYPTFYISIIAVLVLVIVYLPRKAKDEHERLVRRFGEPYVKWDENVPNYLPRLRGYEMGDKTKFSISQVFHNSEHWTVLAVAVGFLVIAFRWLWSLIGG
ncbi:MAG: methyltransferase family protein [Planctomycetota bacterium]|jgi:protein-S-isoprenylcysteine O-methyltransferase Ste14